MHCGKKIRLQMVQKLSFYHKVFNNFFAYLFSRCTSCLSSTIRVIDFLLFAMEGCWKQSGEQKCENTECMALQRSTKALNNTKFCCCHGDYCNLNITNNNLLYSDNKIFNSAPVQKNLASKALALIIFFFKHILI